MGFYKTSVFWVVVILLLCGCSNGEEGAADTNGISNLTNGQSTHVTVEQATESLLAFMSELDGETRSMKKREITEVFTLGGFNETRAIGSSEDTPLVYLFNFADDRGYALMSGDTRVGDVLAFVEKGNLDPQEGTDNPGLAIFLSNADTYYRLKTGLPVYDTDGNLIELMNDDGYDPDIDEDYVEYSDWYDSYEYGKKIPCQWGQEYPLNKFCHTSEGELAMVGCVAVAVGQIMYYYGYGNRADGTAYDWNLIRDFKKWNDYTEPSVNAAAKLLADLGSFGNLDMNYGEEQSGSHTEYVPRTFRNFGYTHVGAIEDFPSLDSSFSESMRKKRPIYMSGYATKRTIPNSTLNIATNNVEYTDGHAWIIDSDLTQKRNIYTYRYDGVLLKTEYETRSLVHCNWGWYGDADGYYFGNALKPAGGLVIGEKPPYGMGTVHYRYILKAIPNIYL